MDPFELADKLFHGGFYLKCRNVLFDLISEISTSSLGSAESLGLVEKAFGSMKPCAEFSDIEKLQLENCIRELALDDSVLYSEDSGCCFALVDIACHCDQLGIITDPSCFLEVLQDVFDLIDEDRCQEIFEYLELRKSEGLFDGVESSRGKGVVLLGLCNELLLRKLSPTQHSNLRGRILKFMDSVLPLADRSGINLRGLSNIDNITEYEGRNAVQEQDLLKPFEDVKAFDQLLDLEKIEKDPSLFYPLFWHLQDLFASGAPLTKLSFDTVKKYIECTVHVIKQVHESQKERNRNATTESNRDPSNAPSVKYLTDKNLFTLQLRDSTFRQAIIIQIILIISNIYTALRVMHSKKIPQAKSTPKSADKPADTEDEDQLFPTSDDRAWVPKIRFALAQIINEMPDGGDITKALKSITNLEDNWIEWKANSCYTFSKDEVMMPEYEIPRPKTFKAKKLCGSEELARLFSQNPDLSAGSNPNLTRPSLDEYLEPLVEQLDPEAGIEEEYLMSNNTEYSWKAFRLASKEHLTEMRDIPNFDLKQLVHRIYPNKFSSISNDETENNDSAPVDDMPVDDNAESMEVDNNNES